jgi:hypothetical protein
MSETRVIAAMDTLAQMVREVDSATYEHTWGHKWFAELKPLLGRGSQFEDSPFLVFVRA